MELIGILLQSLFTTLSILFIGSGIYIVGYNVGLHEAKPRRRKRK